MRCCTLTSPPIAPASRATVIAGMTIGSVTAAPDVGARSGFFACS